jgi:peptide/nickel transport system permease protein
MTSDPSLSSSPQGASAASVPTDRSSLRVNLTLLTGLAIICLNIFVGIFGTFIAPNSAGAFVSLSPFAPPSSNLPLGADYLGRDVLSRLLDGAGLTLGLSFLSTAIGFGVGMLFGFAGSVSRGWINGIIGRAADTLISIPPIMFALLLISGLGSSFSILVLIIAIIHVPRVTRIAGAIASNIVVLEFVEAARARGERSWAIIRREVWPNAVRPLMAEFGLRLTFSVLLVSSMSFLGLGLPPPAADWGTMVRENLGGLYIGSLAVLFPAIAIGLLAIGINLVVDWLATRTGREISGGFI